MENIYSVFIPFVNLKEIVKNYLRTLKKPFAVNLKPLFQNSKKWTRERKKRKDVSCGAAAAINISKKLKKTA